MKRLLACLLSGVLLVSAILAPLCVYSEATQAPVPVVADIRPDAVFLQKQEGCEYSMDGVTWSQSVGFSNLKAETAYTFYQRVAGQQDTVSQPLTVKTTAKTPCTADLLQPTVSYCRTTGIALEFRFDYEYRINGGSWQNSASFDGLTPDTEYVVEQRIRETSRELASEISEPLTLRTRSRGPSTTAHYDLLDAYIEENGVSVDGSPKGVVYVLQDEEGADYYFAISEDTFGVVFELLYDGAEETNLVFDLQMTTGNWADSINVEGEFFLVDGEYIVDQVGTLHTMQKKKYSENYNYAVIHEGDYLTSEMLSQLGGEALKLIFSFWDEQLYSDLGFGMKGLGFKAYDGLGEDCCVPSEKYHLGDKEVAYAREPACGTGGKSYDLYCTVCGELVEAGVYISPTSDHIYDNDCDNDCNNCGYHRAIVHEFVYACEEKCTRCDYRREAAYAEHTYGQDGLCTVCGEMDPNHCQLAGILTPDSGDTLLTLLRDGEPVVSLTVSGSSYLWNGLQPGDYTLTAAKEGYVTRSTGLSVAAGVNQLDLTLCRPGDVVGLGAVNMGDFAAVYAHVKRTAPLEGYALDCADLDGNGGVNMGDVAALYARIRNRK